MSIETNFRRLPPDEYAGILGNEKLASNYFGTNLDDVEVPEILLSRIRERENSGRYLSVGVLGHAFNFLLTGREELGEQKGLPLSPLEKIVYGGIPTPFTGAYGPVRLLATEDVKTVAMALSQIPVAELRARFSVDKFNKAKIYPHGLRQRWTEEDAEPIFEIYPQLVGFFNLAAKEGDLILISSD